MQQIQVVAFISKASTLGFKMDKQLCLCFSERKCAAAIKEHVNRTCMVLRCPLVVEEIHFKGGLPPRGRHGLCVHVHVRRAVGAGSSLV